MILLDIPIPEMFKNAQHISGKLRVHWELKTLHQAEKSMWVGEAIHQASHIPFAEIHHWAGPLDYKYN